MDQMIPATGETKRQQRPLSKLAAESMQSHIFIYIKCFCIFRMFLLHQFVKTPASPQMRHLHNVMSSLSWEQLLSGFARSVRLVRLLGGQGVQEGKREKCGGDEPEGDRANTVFASVCVCSRKNTGRRRGREGGKE